MLVSDIDGLLDIDDLPDEIRPAPGSIPEAELGEMVFGADQLIGKKLEEVEKYYIQRALEVTKGNREEAATLLGIGERTLYRKIKEYQLKE